MRQLLSCHDNVFVVGLNDRAFVIIDGKDSTSVSSSPSPTPPNQSRPQCTIIELLPKDQKQRAGNGTSITQQVGDNPHQRSENELNEVTAVCVLTVPSISTSASSTSVGIDGTETLTVYCVVARGNKSLSIYKWDLGEDESSKSTTDTLTTTTTTTTTTMTMLSPTLVYSTPKRVSHLAFAGLPADGTVANTFTMMCPILVSGDVVGDAYAYNLSEEGQRLLLGHTASMLTGLAVVVKGDENNNGSSSSSNDQYVLTADRDEKIRVSRFPESYVIEGFLTGHTEYITAMVAFTRTIHQKSNSFRVVSCSGDGTIRLWDLDTFTELCCTTASSSDSGSSENIVVGRIPADIAVDGKGQFVAVLSDESNNLKVYEIVQNDTTDQDRFSLQLISETSCPSQPLAVIFYDNGREDETSMMVLMQGPHYLTTFTLRRNDKTLVQDEADGSINASVHALRELAAEHSITMPTSLLEKDQYGKPKLQKETETRGPASAHAPWNRVERVEIAKERSRKRQKRRKAYSEETE